MSFEFQIPSILIVGGGAFARVPEVLTRLHCARAYRYRSFPRRQGLSTRIRESIAIRPVTDSQELPFANCRERVSRSPGYFIVERTLLGTFATTLYFESTSSVMSYLR